MLDRVNIYVPKTLINAVAEYCESKGQKLSAFYREAILNHLENKGNFEIRDIVEAENGDVSEENN